MSADTADALLTHDRRTEEEHTDTERVHDLLLEGGLQEEHEGHGKIMEGSKKTGQRWSGARRRRTRTALSQWRLNKTQR